MLGESDWGTAAASPAELGERMGWDGFGGVSPILTEVENPPVLS